MKKWQAIAFFIIITSSLLLAGCGGGSGSSSPAYSQTVSGVAAAGTPIVGTVYLEDSSEPAKEISTQINSDGTYSLYTEGLTAPFILVADGTVNGQPCTLYSLAGAPGVANVNPLTNLAVFQAAVSVTLQSNEDFYNQYTTVIPQIQKLLQQLLTPYGAATTNFAFDSYPTNHSGLDLLFDMVAITVDISNGSLAITNKMNGAIILNTVLNGSELSWPLNTANIPLVPNQVIGAVNVYPANITIAAGETASFKSIIVGTANQDVTWSVVEAGGGNVTTSGLFTAPEKAGKYHIKVTSASDTENSITAEINVYSITKYVAPRDNSQPRSIVSGPDGAIWFTEVSGEKIGKITTAGVVTEYAMPLPTAAYGPDIIIPGPDGNLWFIESQMANKIGKITASGLITEYAIPTQMSSTTKIVSGPDGNLWFIETQWANKIGKITTDGVITEYAIPTTYSQPNAIVSGPDGNLWFTEGQGKIGKITTAGVVTEYTVPTVGAIPNAIVVGSDGNLWFSESRTSKIGKITTAGVITEYAVPTSFTSTASIISGPDGNLWFTDGYGEKTGKISTAGVAAEVAKFPVSTKVIIPGSDGNIWFAGKIYECVDNSCGDRDCIGKITTTGEIAVYNTPTTGFGANTIISGPDGNIWFIDGYNKSIDVVKN